MLVVSSEDVTPPIVLEISDTPTIDKSYINKIKSFIYSIFSFLKNLFTFRKTETVDQVSIENLPTTTDLPTAVEDVDQVDIDNLPTAVDLPTVSGLSERNIIQEENRQLYFVETDRELFNFIYFIQCTTTLNNRLRFKDRYTCTMVNVDIDYMCDDNYVDPHFEESNKITEEEEYNVKQLLLNLHSLALSPYKLYLICEIYKYFNKCINIKPTALYLCVLSNKELCNQLETILQSKISRYCFERYIKEVPNNQIDERDIKTLEYVNTHNCLSLHQERSVLLVNLQKEENLRLFYNSQNS